ncbi:cytochrome d ubiquinol oxidase subunit II [Acidicapsa acidisoli]|uniref:cytochrome d ubiquinol oxidase subunit II n=1 Tax=Acidicapsa acidisoli TaxID=1615681 RepID=UPI0021E07860|nr:cytochrome d ubiquinol oxidase subunit II [Acidicapsa acidisoli]
MNLPLLCAGFAALSVTFYVLLDGFDLGVGALLLLQPHEKSRDHMVDSITPTWDGNETWLIMTGVTLLAAFPTAYGILMPALYIPIIVMLLALGLRGVSFEFRAQMKRYRRRWDAIFAIGSIVAACMQGLILGDVLQGISVDGVTFSGSVVDCFRPFPALCAICVVAGYVVLGGCWLQLKATALLHGFSARALHIALPLFFMSFCVAAGISLSVQPGILTAWQAHPILLAIASCTMLAATIVLFGSIGKRPDIRPLAAGLVMIAAGIAGIATIVFPMIVPFRVSIWTASSSHLSQIFVLTGAILVTPVVLGYSFFAYWVFRGKTPEKGWDA